MDVSVAVATELGLITPIVTKANLKTLSQISVQTRDLITKARENKRNIEVVALAQGRTREGTHGFSTKHEKTRGKSRLWPRNHSNTQENSIKVEIRGLGTTKILEKNR